MALKVYNTLSRQKEEFKPINEGKVNMFVCGPTVYDYSHLGHAKTYTQFDFIARYLRKKGFEVFYLQNITDIDDKIIKRMNDEGLKLEEIVSKFEGSYIADMTALGNNSVTRLARATDHISDILNQIKVLIEKGYAYRTDSVYYYAVNKFPEYGKLTRKKKLEETVKSSKDDTVSRVRDKPDKMDKRDFSLWKFRKEGEPYWEAEIGNGRPGWHIEDTAITDHYFGQQYDLHGGAIDLMFPHHEAEIAQQEAASGKKPFVKYWLHTGFLNIEGSKMSKSKKNFVTIRDALESYDYKVLRFFFLSNHYRTSIDFRPDVVEQYKSGLQRLTNFNLTIKPDIDDKEHEEAIADFNQKFYSRLDNDFDTHNALAALFKFVRHVNTEGKPGKRVYNLMKEIDGLFGFMTFEEDPVDPDVQTLVNDRRAARWKREWETADRLRAEIKAKGYVVEDTWMGPRVKKI